MALTVHTTKRHSGMEQRKAQQEGFNTVVASLAAATATVAAGIVKEGCSGANTFYSQQLPCGANTSKKKSAPAVPLSSSTDQRDAQVLAQSLIPQAA